jgi:hypothetical protein
MMIRILRVEHRDLGVGPWNARQDGVFLHLMDYNAGRHPSPHDDVEGWRELENRFMWFCGVPDEDVLFSWFHPNLLEILIRDYDFGVYEYMVPKPAVRFGTWQHVFRKDVATRALVLS